MAMLSTRDEERIYVSAVNARKVIRLRVGPGKRGEARIAELHPSEARKIALFLLQSADKLDDRH
jgi:hypothetical protein